MRKVSESLFSVKSIVTLALTAALVYLIISGTDVPAYFQNLYTTVIGFYFGVQAQKAAVRSEGGANRKG